MLVTLNLADKLAAEVAALAPQSGVYSVPPAETIEDAVQAIGHVVGHQCGVVLVGCSDTQLDPLAVMAEVADAHPHLPLVFCAGAVPLDVLAAVRAGARDVLHTDSTPEEIAQVLQRVQAEAEARFLKTPAGSAGAAHRPHFLITIAAPKGGVGRTVLATNLAIALARQHPGDVALIDLDVQFGDVRYCLGLNPQETLVDLGRNAQALTPADLRDRLTPHASGLAVLPGTQSLTEAEELDPDDARIVLECAREAFPYVIVDTAASLNEFTLAALDAATDILLVSSTDIPGVRATRQMIDALDAIEITRSRRHLIINRSTDRYGITVADVEQACGLKAVAQVPAAKEVAMSINQGIPVFELSTKNPLERPLTELARAIDPSIVAEAPSRSTRRFWRGSAA